LKANVSVYVIVNELQLGKHLYTVHWKEKNRRSWTSYSISRA